MGKKVSVVVPVYNEEAGIFEFLDKELSPVLKGLKYETEIILVNDGSKDKTVKEIVASARNLADKINTYSLNDLNVDFGISVDDMVMGINIDDLKDVPIKDLGDAAQEKLNCISADELKNVVDLSDMDLILK